MFSYENGYKAYHDRVSLFLWHFYVYLFYYLIVNGICTFTWKTQSIVFKLPLPLPPFFRDDPRLSEGAYFVMSHLLMLYDKGMTDELTWTRLVPWIHLCSRFLINQEAWPKICLLGSTYLFNHFCHHFQYAASLDKLNKYSLGSITLLTNNTVVR